MLTDRTLIVALIALQHHQEHTRREIRATLDTDSRHCRELHGRLQDLAYAINELSDIARKQHQEKHSNGA
jgi:hypothetical protein